MGKEGGGRARTLEPLAVAVHPCRRALRDPLVALVVLELRVARAPAAVVARGRQRRARVRRHLVVPLVAVLARVDGRAGILNRRGRGRARARATGAVVIRVRQERARVAVARDPLVAVLATVYHRARLRLRRGRGRARAPAARVALALEVRARVARVLLLQSARCCASRDSSAS